MNDIEMASQTPPVDDGDHLSSYGASQEVDGNRIPTNGTPRTIDGDHSSSSDTHENISNPFLMYDWDDLKKSVDRTINVLDLHKWRNFLQRGANYARDSSHFYETVQSSDEERDALKLEEDPQSGFWVQSTKVLRGGLFVATLGAMIQGMTQSINNAANFGIIQSFGLHVYKDGPVQFNNTVLMKDISINLNGIVYDFIDGTNGTVQINGTVCMTGTNYTNGPIQMDGTNSTHCPMGTRPVNMNGVVFIDGANYTDYPLSINGTNYLNDTVNLSGTVRMNGTISMNDTGLYSNTDVWRFSALNAMPLLAGGMISPLLIDPLQEHYLGRRGAIFVSALLTFASTIAACFARSYNQLIGIRILSGVALGAKASVIPIYTSEISPSNIRGRLGANWQIKDALGIAFGFIAVLAIQAANMDLKLAWRIETATILIPTILLMLMVYMSAAESPYWKLKKSLPMDAYEILRSLRPVELIAARDFIYTHYQLDVESRLAEQRRSQDYRVMISDLKTRLETTGFPPDHVFKYELREKGYWQRLVMLFRDPMCRRALLCSSWAMASQQLTGINAIAFLLFLLPTGNKTPDQSERMIIAWIGFAFGAANWLFGLPAYWLADRVGRATLMLVGLPNQAWLTLALAFCFKISGHARNPVLIIVICLYTAVYSFTSGPCAFAIASEVFPLSVREVGMAASIAVNFILLGMVILFFLPLSHALQPGGSYTSIFCIFAALNVIAFVGVLLFVPETKGRKLEDLQYTFELPTSMHIEYRMNELKWCWNKYIRRKRQETMDPFYKWARKQWARKHRVMSDANGANGGRRGSVYEGC